MKININTIGLEIHLENIFLDILKQIKNKVCS